MNIFGTATSNSIIIILFLINKRYCTFFYLEIWSILWPMVTILIPAYLKSEVVSTREHLTDARRIQAIFPKKCVIMSNKSLFTPPFEIVYYLS